MIAPTNYIEDKVYGQRLLISENADQRELHSNIRAARAILHSFPDVTRNYRHRKMPYSIQKSYAMKCDFLECAETLQDIYARTSFHFEKYQDHYSIRITQQWRIELDIDKV